MNLEDFLLQDVETVELYHAKLKFHKEFRIATGSSTEEDVLIVVVKAGDVTGFGDGFLTGELESISEEFLKGNLLNLSNPGLKIAVSSALLDAYAKTKDKPLSFLLSGEPPKEILTDFTIGIEDLQETLEDLDNALKMGFKRIKLKMGIGSLEDEIKRLLSVLERLPDDVLLRIDANQGWSFEKAKAILDVINRNADRIEILEQPLKANALAETKKLRMLSSVPIVLDESIRTTADLDKIGDSADGVNAKVSKAGSVLEAFRLLREAKERGYLTMLGCSYETNIGIAFDIHIASAVNVTFADLDADILKEDIVEEKVIKLHGSMRIPEKRVGIGDFYTKIKWNSLEKIAVREMR